MTTNVQFSNIQDDEQFEYR